MGAGALVDSVSHLLLRICERHGQDSDTGPGGRRKALSRAFEGGSACGRQSLAAPSAINGDSRSWRVGALGSLKQNRRQNLETLRRLFGRSGPPNIEKLSQRGDVDGLVRALKYEGLQFLEDGPLFLRRDG